MRLPAGARSIVNHRAVLARGSRGSAAPLSAAPSSGAVATTTSRALDALAALELDAAVDDAAHARPEPHAAGHACGELLCDRAHAEVRHARRARGHHRERLVDQQAREPELAVEEDPGEERPQEALAQRGRQAEVAQALVAGRLRSRRRKPVARARAPAQQRGHVAGTPQPRAQRREQARGLAARVGDRDDVARADVDVGAGLEPPQVERGEIELCLRLRVGLEQHREAAIEAVAVDDVGAEPATDAILGLEHDRRAPGGREQRGAGETREPGADDDVGKVIVGGHRATGA